MGANTTEAQAVQSRKDFISKMSISSKETKEANYWLKLLEASDYLYGFQKKNLLMSKSMAIMKIITKIVKSSREKVKVGY